MIAHLCKTRNVRAGSVVGSGTVSNKDWTHGYSCIAEKRAIETIEDGKPKTGFMKFGDTIRIEVKGKDGQSVFGAIDQKIVELEQPEPSKKASKGPSKATVNDLKDNPKDDDRED